VDTTGAGDVFHAGFIYGLLRNWEIAEILRFANAVAALKCRDLGGRRGIPTLEEVNRLLTPS
jgi:sulfofructose kinase